MTHLGEGGEVVGDSANDVDLEDARANHVACRMGTKRTAKRN
jgi:hypothetical protein